ncbi:Ldh family oxidoreductase [Rhodococcus wratislaviensis]|uniref:Ldh family oxidoreductase n=1 Tax=Rhodococcus wratislaviensis TaxID=44752 RepID=UPI00351737F7
MKIEITRLRSLMLSVLVTAQIPQHEAEVGAEMILDAELRGHRSHGVRLIRNVLAEYAAGADRRSEITRLTETSVSARVDGGFHLSLFVHRTAIDLAIEKARQSGVGLVGVTNAGVSGQVGYLVERAARAGFVAFSLNTSPLTVVAPGSPVPSLGTNPLAIAVPLPNAEPIVLDMATSAIPFNQVRRLRDEQKPLPEGVAVDGTGSPTTDPAAALDADSGRGRILPFGGHRGYGLALMLELLVAGGVIGRTGEAKRGPELLEPADFASLYFLYRPALVGEADAGAAVEALLMELRDQGARIPGEVSAQRRSFAVAEGNVEIDGSAWAMLKDLAGDPT